MIDLKYSLVIEATDDPTFFGFYSPDLERLYGSWPFYRRLLIQGQVENQ